MIKYHFYKQGTEPDLPGLRYANHAHGIWGYLAPQSLKWYMGYKDIQTMESELKQAENSHKRNAQSMTNQVRRKKRAHSRYS